MSERMIGVALGMASAANRTCQQITNNPSRNLYNYELSMDGKYANYNNNSYTSSANFATSGRVPVVPGNSYVISWSTSALFSLNLGQPVRAYNHAGELLGMNPKVGSYALARGMRATMLSVLNNRYQMLVTIAPDCEIAFIEFTIIYNVAHTTEAFNSHVRTIQVEIGQQSTSFETYGVAGSDTKVDDSATSFDYNALTKKLQKSNVLYGKSFATAGDSITYGTDIGALGTDVSGVALTYGKCIANRNYMPFFNYGVAGSTMQDITGKNGFSNAARYQAMDKSLDYLTIWFGWNDNAYGTLGTISDTDATASFYGAWNTVLPWLISNYPTTKIGLIVPYVASANIRQAVRDVGIKWGIPYLDLYAANTPFYYDKETGVDASVVTARQAAFQAVGAHPNEKGHYYLSTIIENFLRTL